MQTCQIDLARIRYSIVLTRRDENGYLERIVIPYRGVAALSTRVLKTDEGLSWLVRMHVTGIESESFLLGPFDSADAATDLIKQIVSAAWKPDNF